MCNLRLLKNSFSNKGLTRNVFCGVFFIFFLSGYGQTGKDIYLAENLTSSSMIEVLDKAEFEPQRINVEMREFKSAILQLQKGAIKQLNISTWYMCTRKYEEYFNIYNSYYKIITRAFYETNCKELNALMILDGVVKQPK